MKSDNVISTWFLWQFYEMPRFLLQVWKNYFMFAANFFSAGLLLRTFFAPWRRYKWRYPKALDLKEFFNTLISNTFSRALGASMRIILIIAGIIFQVFVLIIGFVIFVGWLALPLAVIFGIIFLFVF